MSDPLTTLPRLDGIYAHMPLHLTDAAVKLGWLPIEGSRDPDKALMLWINCACGRPMRLPL
jgi:hypothetical protein